MSAAEAARASLTSMRRSSRPARRAAPSRRLPSMTTYRAVPRWSSLAGVGGAGRACQVTAVTGWIWPRSRRLSAVFLEVAEFLARVERVVGEVGQPGGAGLRRCEVLAGGGCDEGAARAPAGGGRGGEAGRASQLVGLGHHEISFARSRMTADCSLLGA